MTIEEFIKALGINTSLGTQKSISDTNYELMLEGSNAYASVYTKLDKSDLVDLDVEKMALTEHSIYLPYIGDQYDVILEGDLDKNIYTLKISLGE